MQGFKSFARKTNIPFGNSMNVIVGPNGSGKSNITDALCFVLGRLSIKSLRAAKAANLLFSGNKIYKGSKEASVELVFDNADKTFSVDESEVIIKRIVRKSGSSIYKINGVTKTRQDLLELLSQAGIDPNGFNIVLQGEIQSLVKSTAEDRRKIIEEVAGISIYTTRKHKSLRELEKTDERLAEATAIVRERKSYLRSLDRERLDANNYQKLEHLIKRCKVTLLSKDSKEKEGEVYALCKIIENHSGEIKKIKKQIEEKNSGINLLQEEVALINKKIQSSTSSEQEVLHKEISDLKAEHAGLMVRFENFENRIESGDEKKEEYTHRIKEMTSEISKIKIEKPEIRKKQEEQKVIQEKIDKLEEKRRRFYHVRSELSTIEDKRNQKERFIIESKKEINLLESSISDLFNEIKYAKSLEKVQSMGQESKRKLDGFLEEISKLEKEIGENERENAVLNNDIKRQDRLKSEVTNLDLCPVCRQNVTEDHKHTISTKSIEKVTAAKEKIEKNIGIHTVHSGKIASLKKAASQLQAVLNELDIDRVKLKNSEERKEQIKRLSGKLGSESKELAVLEKRLLVVKKDYDGLRGIEEEYDEVRMHLQELNFKDLDSDAEVSMKKREINRLNLELKAIARDIEESRVELKKAETLITEKENILEKKELEEQALYEKFQKFFSEKNEFQDKQKALETDIIGLGHTLRNFEDKVNHNKISKAQFDAQLESLKTEIATFGDVEVLAEPADKVREKLSKSQFNISRLGNVNMKALEVFDTVKEQVAQIEEKVTTIGEEKEKIEKIIAEIDRKKKRAFMGTLNVINEYFSRNFKQLSRKGSTFLELENKKDPFDGGLNILVKVSRGRYFDITSLSGGEKTMVALSLIFAIQEYRPYSFYIFDEIDAALDKHNSELLAALIKKYMVSGQYLIITHNDTLISEATNLYGVSMQENISKIISLKV
jgi:chromosome segregation protein